MKTLARTLGFVLLFGPLPRILAQIPTPIHGVTVAAVKLVRLNVWITSVAEFVLMATMANAVELVALYAVTRRDGCEEVPSMR